ncbi:MAG: glycosyltransferase family 39 protein, partial [bacterium]
MQKIRLSPEWQVILVLAFAKLAVHFFTNTNYGLHRDAFLYLALGDHLDFGYVAVPPLIAMIAKLTLMIFGDSVFAVRLFPALIGAASVVVIGMIVRMLGGKMWAILLACTAFIVSPAFLRSNTLFQPVSFNQFFWLLAMYFAIKLVHTKNPKFWLHLGIVCGLAFLNKYSIAFLVLALLIALLLTPDRKLLQSKYFLYALLTGFIIILPNLIWQYNHNWPVVTHMLTLQRTQLVNVNIADFLVAQMLMNLPGLFVWMFGLAYLLFFEQGKKFRFLAYTFVVLLLILLLLRGKPYYTLGIYTSLFAVGGYAIERYFSKKWQLVKPVFLAFMIAIVLPVLPYSLPLLRHEKMIVYAEQSKDFGFEGALRWEDGRIHALPQDYADMI